MDFEQQPTPAEEAELRRSDYREQYRTAETARTKSEQTTEQAEALREGIKQVHVVMETLERAGVITSREAKLPKAFEVLLELLGNERHAKNVESQTAELAVNKATRDTESFSRFHPDLVDEFHGAALEENAERESGE